ncbi:MAG: hypothetical protein EXS64_09195 [Candidatus Latescibacteria bacterium]|nr:hypothetical protein [Candidatus Latescibacterota bacterium]
MKAFPSLETKTFIAYIADNAALGIHRAGYNGIASLIPRHSGNNLFVPVYAGLNYETIWLPGLPPYQQVRGSKFEPRAEPMQIEAADAKSVTLVQPETSHAHVGARITFSVEEPCYLHQRIEVTFHRKFCGSGEKNRFRSLYASYMHTPPDRHIYLQADPASGDLSDWIGITKADHAAPDTQIRRLPDGRELTAAEHLAAMNFESPLSESALSGTGWPSTALPRNLDGPLSFYYGLCHDAQLFLMMFKQPERFRLAYSPCGGGQQPAWSPAWDYILHLDDAEIGPTYTWDLCLALKPFEGRTDVLQEVRRYLGG